MATVYIPTNEKAGLIYGDLNSDNLLDLIVSTGWEGAGTSVHACSYFVYLNKNNGLELTDIVNADSFYNVIVMVTLAMKNRKWIFYYLFKLLC
ncbi:MAG: hypothetical protein IPO23_07280 [Flavobacterium sp.]|nr:hypothetical protein [Flavobacterium sp.]